jgi:hypothetical protein
MLWPRPIQLWRLPKREPQTTLLRVLQRRAELELAFITLAAIMAPEKLLT